ncbi:energy-coupling factor ABC transporter ATP-binding protein [Diaphorobacter caeni]|uniref:energy-coupling factor ABC transporter ATP-binding protein n=1 Tax=Diaphorobacter caeni TaxID=2784387 RepID=UPI0018906211|nr:ABC transporter ATP-binding protein [Diaphorobacter caeni]MBF5004353.1 ABC transporter ATP-binding protein [Diaphorobacter caeni]
MNSPTSIYPPLSDSPIAGITLQDVTLQRGRTRVFDGLSLSLHEPRIGLIGDNGAGKTSLLRLLCGLDAPQSGRVAIGGTDIHSPGQPGGQLAGQSAGQNRAALVGLMFQNPDDQIIFPVVVEEIALSLRTRGMKKSEAQQAARALFAERGVASWADRAVSSLSQGQRQQICWLALQAAGPRVLLLDEPYASLDLPGQARLAQDIASADQQVLVSTHLLSHVRGFSRVIWLDQGRVRADGCGVEVCAEYEADVASRVHLPSH